MHGAVASTALGEPDLVKAVIADWRTAPVDGRLRAVFPFLEKLTLDPQSVTPADVAPLRAAGLEDGAIEDAIHVCALFNMFDRVADALGFGIPEAAGVPRIVRTMLKVGYRL